ncbi:hypothetical protein RVR_2465 [Actinacidiphila reveromycinica]|uniref:NAD(+)--protein-arginine ADP-ribosyltransferase n=1 Tax=Actinacidiphila reveromycinica TaxID=659352 RepID=A0A7U3UQN2_9ACTN|nr:hypothetical protein RVR_2465 [Streptomyces sp. SN-593]
MVLVEDHGVLVLLRSPSDDSLGAADVADLIKGLGPDRGNVTVVAGAHAVTSAEFWPRVGELMDSFKAAGVTAVRLALVGTGDDRPDRPAVARSIAEDWEMAVEAPDGMVLAVPGGSLFVPSTAGAQGSWWRFAPDAEPVRLGPRCAPPVWQASLGGLPAVTSGGCAVHDIPAGLLIRPAESAPIAPGDLYHAIPVHPRQATVVVGVPYGEDVSAEEVADLLSTAPGFAKSVRLVPGGLEDVLPLAQRVSDLLDTEIEVTTGLPLFAADRPMDFYAARSVLVAADGTPGWLPFVDSVVCRPTRGSGPGPAPRLLRWSPPLPGPGRPAEGTVRLSERWQVMVTRAGLWVDRQGGPRARPPARPVSTEGPSMEVGAPGAPLDASLWPALSRLFAALTPDLRSRATLYVHGVPVDGGRELRRLAAHYGLRTIRYSAAGPLASPGAALLARPDTDVRPQPNTSSLPRSVRGPVGRSGGAVQAPENPSVSRSVAGLGRGPALVGEAKADTAAVPGAEEPVPGPSLQGPAPTRAAGPARRSQGGPGLLLVRHSTSTSADRRALKQLAGSTWERHSDFVERLLAALPGLGDEEREAARVDLIALHAYLDQADDVLGHSELTATLRKRDSRLLPYAACLASALGRIPPCRGTVLRGTGERYVRPGSLRPGAVLRDLAPVSAVLADAAAPDVQGARYALWSVTGRRVRPFADGADGPDEVVFPAGTSFRVLDVRTDGDFPLFLLRESPGPGPAAGIRPPEHREEAGEPDDTDDAVLVRLDAALTSVSREGRPAPTAGWPPRCAGPVGEGP